MSPIPLSFPVAPPLPRKWTLARVVGCVSVSLFIATEIAVAGGAGIWAISGLLGASAAGTMILAVMIGLPALYAIYKCTRLAMEAETDPLNE